MSQESRMSPIPDDRNAPSRQVLQFHTFPDDEYGMLDWSRSETSFGPVTIPGQENPCVAVRIGAGVPREFVLTALRGFLSTIEMATMPEPLVPQFEAVRKWFTPAPGGK